MSRTIDERVVEMRFDNRHFESNVSNTMSTLDKLKQKLNFSGASKGLEDINAAANKVNMSGLGGAVDSIKLKFSAMEVMAVTALSNITNSAVNAGKRIVSALTIDPIKTGFDEYETKINAIQTIMSNTASKGTTMADVTRVLAELNTYADKTIYNFAEMTRNIGTFTAAGVGLETSATAIQGIANLAAASGSNAQQAATAMYQLSQALASGTVKLMDWNSVVNAGMGGEKFQEALKETARRHGIAVDAMIEKNGSFRESLREEWITAEILTETLNNFTVHGAKEYTAAMVEAGKMTEAQAEALNKEAQAMEDAATKVKTFTQLWDTLKESAQSGWATTWELIVGDFEEAKEFFSELSDLFGGIIGKSAESRNKLLEGALSEGGAGGWAELEKRITDAGIAVEDFNAALKETAKEEKITVDEVIKSPGLIIKTLKKFADGANEASKSTEVMTDKLEYFQKVVDDVWRGDYGNVDTGRFEKLAEAGYDYAVVQDLVNKTIDGHRLTLEDLSDVQLKNIGYTDDQIKAIRKLAEEAEKTGTPLNELIHNLNKPSGRELLVDSLRNILNGLVNSISAVGKAWRNVFPPMTSEQLYGIIEGFNKLTSHLVLNSDQLKDLTRTFEGLFAILDIVLTVVGGPLKWGFEALKTILGMFNMDILDFTASIADSVIALRDWIDGHNIFLQGIEVVAPIVKQAVEMIGKWIEAAKNSKVVAAVMTYIGDVFSRIGKLVGGIDIGTVLNDIGSFFVGAYEGVKNWIEVLKESENIPRDIILGLVNGLASGIPTVITTVIELAKSILTTICEILGIHSPSTETMAIGENVTEGFVIGIQNGASSVWETIKSFGAKCLELLGNIDFGAILAGSIGLGMTASVYKISTALEAFASPFEGVGDVLSGVGKVLDKSAKPIEKILNNTSKVVKSFSKTLNSISFSIKANAIKDLAIALAIMIGAFTALAMIDTDALAAGVGAVFALGVMLAGLVLVTDKISKSSAEISKNGVQLNNTGASLLSIAGAILMLGAVVKIVGNMRPEKAISGFISLIAIMAALVGFIVVLNKIPKIAGKGIHRVGPTLLTIAGAIAVMALIVVLLSKISASTLARGIVAVVALGGLITGLIAATKLAGKNVYKVGKTLLGIAGAIAILSLVCILLGTVSPEILAKGSLAIIALGAIVVGLIAVTRLAENQTAKIGSTILGIAGALSLLGVMVVILGFMSVDHLAKGIVAVTALGGVITGLIAATKLAGTNAKNIGKTLLSVAGAIAILATIAVVLGFVDVGHLAKGIIAVGILSAMMAGLIYATSFAKYCKKNLIVLTVAVGLLAAAIVALSLLDSGKVAAASTSLSMVIGVFALLIASTKFLGDTKTIIKSLLPMLGAITVLAGIVAALTLLNPGSVLQTCSALSLLLTSMSVSMVLISKVGKVSMSAVGSLALIGLVVGELAVILGLMAAFNVAPSIEVAASLSTLLLSMSAALVILAKVGTTGPAAFIGIGALAALITGIGALIVGIGALVAEFPILETFLDAGIPILEKIGYALGSFFGNIVGGFLGNVTSGLPDMANDLSLFMTNLKPFIEGARNVDSDVMDGVKAIAETILILTAADLLSGLTSWLTGGSSISDFSAQLVPFAEAMTDFSSVVSGNIDEDAVAAAANAGKIMAEMASTIPNSGGVLGFFAGENDMSMFAEQLVPFGKAMSEFSSVVSGNIDEGAVTAAANAGKTMSEMASTIPNSGGVVGFFTGENDIAMFGTQLVLFGKAITEFSSIVAGNINEDAVIAAANAGKTMSEMASTIPNTGGVVAFFSGDNDMATFGAQLVLFGKAMAEFSSTVSGNVNEEAVTAAANAGTMMADLANKLPDTGGIVSWFAGDNDIATFGKQLVEFGKYFAEYAEAVKGVDPDAVGASTSVVGALVELQNGLPDDGGWFSGKLSLADFGSDLSTFGSHLATYHNNVGGIDAAKLTSITNEIGKLLDVFKSMGDINADGAKSFASALSQLGQSGVDSFLGAFKNADSKIKQAGSDMVANFLSGINAKKSDISSAFEPLVDNVVSYVSSKQSMFKSSGEAMISGLIEGITSKTASAATATSTIADSLLTKFKDKYRDFTKVGSELITRLINGIKNKKRDATSAISSLVSSLVTTAKNFYAYFDQAGRYLVTGFAEGIAANTWYAEAKARAMAQAAVEAAKEELDINSPSKVFRDEVGMGIPEGTAVGIEENTYMATDASEQMSKDIIEASEEAFDEDKFEKDIGSIIGGAMSRGILTGADKAVKTSNKASQKVIKGTKEAFEKSTEWIERHKSAGDLSLIDELSAWERVQSRYKRGTDERKKADEEIARLRTELKDATEEYYSGVLDVQKETNEKRIKLDQEYYDKTKEINEKLESDIQALNDKYTEAVDSRARTLYDSYSLFDGVKPEKYVTGLALMENLQDQLVAFEDWTNNINALASRGLDTSLVDELREMGISSAAEIKALNAMSDVELNKYVDLWRQKHGLAKAQATFELEDMRVETQTQIETLRTEASAELELYKETWVQNVQALADESKVKLEDLKTTWMEKVVGLKVDTESEFSKMVTQVTDILGGASGWSESGASIIEGVISGVANNSSRLTTTIESVMSSALETAKKTLGINSPSKEFGKLGMYSDEGFALNLIKFAYRIEDSAETVGNRAIKALGGSIAKISDLVESGIDVQPTIRPVLDLSNVEAGAARLNTMFGRTQAMSINSAMNRSEASEAQNGETTPATGNVYTFTQNNYSPKALSRLDIYRQTKNQFSAMKGLVEK